MESVPAELVKYLIDHGPFAFFMLLLIVAVVYQAKVITVRDKTIELLQEKRIEETRILTELVGKFTQTVDTVMAIVQRKP